MKGGEARVEFRGASERWPAWLPYGVLSALIVLVYARTVGFGAYFDDQHFIRPWSIDEVLGAFHGPFDPQRIEPDYFRPLVGVTFGAEWHLWGYDTWGYHLTNIALHAVAACMVCSLLVRLGVRRWAAAAGAMYFAVVPANVATAVYLAERSDAMAAIAIVAGLRCVITYHRHRRPRTLVALVTAFVVAVLGKEIGLALVPMALALWWYLGLDEPASTPGPSVAAQVRAEVRAWSAALVARRHRAGWLRVSAVLVACAVAYVGYRQAVLPAGSLGDRVGETTNPVTALVKGVWSTLKGVPWEVRPWHLPALVVVVGLCLVLRPSPPAWRRAVLGVWWVIGGVLPLTFSGGTEPRLLYVAQIGAALAMAVVADVAGSILGDSGARARRPAGAAVAAGTVALAVSIGVTTVLAQDEFRPGSDKKLDADEGIWNDPVERDLYPPYWVEQIERRLIEAGRISG